MGLFRNMASDMGSEVFVRLNYCSGCEYVFGSEVWKEVFIREIKEDPEFPS